MVFLWLLSVALWFPYGFPMKSPIFLGFSYCFPMDLGIFLHRTLCRSRRAAGEDDGCGRVLLDHRHGDLAPAIARDDRPGHGPGRGSFGMCYFYGYRIGFLNDEVFFFEKIG